MKTKTTLLLLVVAASFGFFLARIVAQSPAKAGGAVNRVAFENEVVRVIEYSSQPGGPQCGFGKHSHPAHLAILLTDSKVRVVADDGKVTIEDGKAGEMFWEPAATHEVADISGKDGRCYLIEVKDKAWKPSTGLTK